MTNDPFQATEELPIEPIEPTLSVEEALAQQPDVATEYDATVVIDLIEGVKQQGLAAYAQLNDRLEALIHQRDSINDEIRELRAALSLWGPIARRLEEGIPHRD